MARYVTTVETDRSRDDAFAYMAAFENTREWDPGIVEAERLDPGDPGVGTRFKVVASASGRKIPLEYRIREFEPGRRVVLVAESSSLRSVDVITVEDRGPGAAVTYDATVDLRGALRVFNPLFDLSFKRVGQRAADGLRRRIGR